MYEDQTSQVIEKRMMDTVSHAVDKQKDTKKKNKKAVLYMMQRLRYRSNLN